MSDRTQEADGTINREQLITLLAAQLEHRSLSGAMETIAALLRSNPHDRDALDLRELLDDQLNTVTAGQVGTHRALSRHRSWVNAVAYSPDGRRIISGAGGSLASGAYQDGPDRSVRIWDAGTGRPLYCHCGHRSAVQALAYSLDGRRFLTASRRGCITLWDASFLTLVRHLQTRGAAVASAAFAPDGRSALTASDDKSIRLWSVRDGRLLRCFEGHTAAVSSVAFSPDGNLALSGSFDRTVRLWDVATGKLIRRLDGHTQLVESVTFAGDGQALSAGADQAIILWDLSTGKEVRRFVGHTTRVKSVAFSPEGRFVLSGGADHTVRVWDVTDGRELRCFRGHTDQVVCVAFSPGGLHAVSGSRDTTLRLWQMPNLLETLRDDGGGGFNLVEALRASQLLDAAQLAELAEIGLRYTDPRALAWHLLERGWVTSYQIHQLVLQRSAGLSCGPYLVFERLGEGGMGQVLKGKHRKSHQVVALKVPRTAVVANPDEARLFWWESQVLDRLTHPNIVALHSATDQGDRPFIALEFIAGTDLEVLVKRTGPLPPGRAASFIYQAAVALEHARQRNLIHRDIKPANLISLAEPAIESVGIKVLDWGLADVRPRGTKASPLAPTEMVGTADYMAPEQANDPSSTDIRSDIYSLGCTLYFLLTGQPPFAGGTLAQKLLRHQMKEPPPIEEQRGDLPPGLQDVIRKMMAKQPEDRYQTPAEVAAALAPFRETETPPLGERTLHEERRRFARHPWQERIHIRVPLRLSEPPVEGTALDISQSGIRIRTAEQHASGMILALGLCPLGPASLTMLARVIHVREDADSTWVMGCAFARPLNAEAVQSLRDANQG